MTNTPSKAWKAFLAASKRAEKAIQALREGVSDDGTDAERKVYAVINRLDERADSGEIRGDDAVRDQAFAITAALRASVRGAADEGRAARQARRHAEIQRLRDEERERRAGMGSYERELEVMRLSRK